MAYELLLTALAVGGATTRLATVWVRGVVASRFERQRSETLEGILAHLRPGTVVIDQRADVVLHLSSAGIPTEHETEGQV